MNINSYEQKIALRLFDVYIIKQSDMSVSPETITSGITSYLSTNFKDIDGWAILEKVLNPIVIASIFKFIGISSWWSVLAGAVLEYFDIRLSDIIKSICSSIYDIVKTKVKPTESQIANIVDSTISNFFPGTEKVATVEQLDALSRRFKTELILSLEKKAQISSSIAGSALKLFFKHFFGALIGQTLTSKVKEVLPTNILPQEVKQVKYPIKSSFQNKKYFSNVSRSYDDVANDTSVTKFLISLADEKYDVTKIINNILNNDAFFEAKSLILQESLNSPTKTITIPSLFSDKSSLIDYFMNDVFEESNL